MNRWMRRILAVLQVGGGAVGLVFLTMSRPWTRELSRGFWFLLALYVCVFLFAIAAGLLLAEATRRGVRWSAVCQAIQIPTIVSSVLTYRFCFGACVTVGSFGTNWVAEPAIGTTSMLSIGQLVPVSPLMTTPGWGITLVALTAFLYLLRHLRKPSACEAPQKPSGPPERPIAETPGEDDGG